MGSNHLPSSGGAQAPPHQRSASGRELASICTSGSMCVDFYTWRPTLLSMIGC